MKSKIMSVASRFKQYLHREEEILLSNKIAEMVKPFAGTGMKILEVGCSDGYYAIDRGQRLGRVEIYGVDIGKKRLAKAKEKGIHAFSCDIENELLPFDNEYFDIIICNQVMEHLMKIHLIMDECHRVLKGKGIFLVSVPNLAALHNRLLLLIGKQPTTLQIMSEHLRGFAPDAFKEYLLFNRIFTLLSYKSSGFYPFPHPLSVYLSKFLPRLSTFQIALLQKDKNEEIKWVAEFQRRHIDGYGEDFWFE